MRILVRLAKVAAALALLLVLVGAVGYWGLGLRMQLDGSGAPRLARVQSPASLASDIESHRKSQRSTDPVAVAASPPPAVAPDRPVEVPAARPPAEHRSSADLAYWVGFRGPLRDGHYRERAIKTAWPSDGLEPVWKQPAGGGYASFAIARGLAFTIEQRRSQEVVTAYDVATGREVWANAWDANFQEWMGGDGPRATPSWADGRIYALGALGELRCLDAGTGRLIWRINILQDNGALNLPWGMAASPLIVEDTVVVLPGGPNGRSVVAYDRRTGSRRWSSLDDKQAYSSPMLVSLNGREQILVLTGTRLAALAPDSGELLWSYPWITGNDINASQPLVIGDRRVLLSSAYGHGAAVIEVGDEGGRPSVRTVWEHTRLKNRFSSSVLHEGHVYGLDENILTCVNADTGDVRWKAGRYGHGQLVLASGHLIVLSERGELALVRATPEKHDEAARFPALEGKSWNHPALDDGILLVRNLAEMAAFDLRVR